MDNRNASRGPLVALFASPIFATVVALVSIALSIAGVQSTRVASWLLWIAFAVSLFSALIFGYRKAQSLSGGAAALLSLSLVAWVGVLLFATIKAQSFVFNTARLSPRPISQPPNSVPTHLVQPSNSPTTSKPRPQPVVRIRKSQAPLTARDLPSEAVPAAPAFVAKSNKLGGDGPCQANSIGGNATVEGCVYVNAGPPPLKVNFSVFD